MHKFKLEKMMFNISIFCLFLFSHTISYAGNDDATREDVFAFSQNLHEQGYRTGTYSLGELYRTGYGVKQDYKKSAYYFDIACKSNFKDSCYQLANAYYYGYGAKKDYAQASYLYESSCSKNIAPACNNLAIIYQSGKVGQRDYRFYMKLYKKACDLGSKKGCNNFKHTHKTLFDVAQSECNKGDAKECYNLAVDFYKGNKAVAQDKNKASLYFNKACQGGFKRSCKYATKLTSQSKNKPFIANTSKNISFVTKSSQIPKGNDIF